MEKTTLPTQTIFCAYTGSDTGISICARNISSGVIEMTYRGDGCAQVVVVEGCYLVGVDEVRPKIIVWVVNKKDAIHTIACPSRPRCISASECYVVAGIENTIYLWMSCTGSLLRTVEHHLQPVTSLCFESNHMFVSGDEEGCVAVWSVQGLIQRPQEHEPFGRSDHHSSRISHLSLCRSGFHAFVVASASLDRSVRVWQGRRMRQTHVSEHAYPATCLLIHHDLLIVAFEDGSLKTTSLTDSTIPPTTIPHKSPITSMVLGGGGELLVGMSNGEVAVSLLRQAPHKFFKHPGRVTCLLVVEGLEGEWTKASWKAPLPFIPFSTRPDAGGGGREMVMRVRGHSMDGEDDVERMVKKLVVEVVRKEAPVVASKERRRILEDFLKQHCT